MRAGWINTLKKRKRLKQVGEMEGGRRRSVHWSDLFTCCQWELESFGKKIPATRGQNQKCAPKSPFTSDCQWYFNIQRGRQTYRKGSTTQPESSSSVEHQSKSNQSHESAESFSLNAQKNKRTWTMSKPQEQRGGSRSGEPTDTAWQQRERDVWSEPE